MVTIRLSRHGSKKRPFYHIVVTESESARDGRFIEQIGTYDPAKPMTSATVDRGRLDHWVGVGAQISETLAKVLREQQKTAAAS